MEGKENANGGKNGQYWKTQCQIVSEENRQLRVMVEQLENEKSGAVSKKVVSDRDLNPLYIFPSVVWDGIVNSMLTTPEDVHSCCQAFPSLSNELTVKKTQWMFQLVLPKLANILDFNTVLKLRLVCSFWNRGIEEYIEDHPRWKSHNEQILAPFPPLMPGSLADTTSIVELSTLARVKQFTEQMAELDIIEDRNPFVGRALKITCGPADISIWHDAIMDLFERHGTHLWYLDAVLEMTPVEVSYILPRILQRAPNLRWLMISGQARARMCVDHMRAEVYRNLFYNPLPRMRHMHSLHLHINFFLPDLSKHVTQVYSKQLTVLTARTKDMCVEDYLYIGPMQPMKQLVLVHFVPARGKDIFHSFAEHAPNVERLTLLLPPQKISSNDYIYREPSFEWMMRWMRWTRLKTLEIRSKVEFTEFLSDWRYRAECQLPNLNTFRLTTCPAFDYDMMLSMPNLKQLHLTIDLVALANFFQIMRQRSNARMDVAKHLFEEYHGRLNLYQSNVWDKLPKLETVTVYGYHRDAAKSFRWIKTREGYNTFCQKKQIADALA